MLRQSSKEQKTVQIGNQSAGARQREHFQVMMSVAEKYGRPDQREGSKQMVRVGATWNNSLSQLASTSSRFLDSSSNHGREKRLSQESRLGLKVGERFLNVSFLLPPFSHRLIS